MTSVLTINAGSSSIRMDLIEAVDPLRRLGSFHGATALQNQEALLREFLQQHGQEQPEFVVHRIVHGGLRFSATTRIDAAVEDGLTALTPWAPLHMPAALAWLRAARSVLPEAVQLAVFDTEFFAELPKVASTYALPRELCTRLGLRRFGFHGLAHAAMWRRFTELRGDRGRVITLQLGSGCSAAAILDGRPLDISMGFSPMEGLVMGTRSGDLDPGLLLHLQRTEGLNPDATERLLNESSGLLGLSGISADMQKLCASKQAAAREAIAVFTYRVKKYIGAYTAVLGGLDGLLFGGGIGEHSPRVRAACLHGLSHLGIALSAKANEAACAGEACISQKDSQAPVFTVAADEAGELCRHAFQWFKQQTGARP